MEALIGLMCVGIICIIPVISVIAVIIGLCNLFSPPVCGICGIQFKRNTYTWTIDGVEIVVCPKCNTKLERQNSDQKFKKWKNR